MMPSRQPVLAGRISSLKDSIFTLCNSIGTYIKTAESGIKPELKGIVAELRLLGGSLYSLQAFIQELEESDENSDVPSPTRQKVEWPVIDGCELLVEALSPLFPYSQAEGLREAKTALIGYRSKLGFVLSSSESLEDISLHFSVLGKEPLPILSVNEKLSIRRDSLHALPDREPDEPSAEDVSTWLTILTSAEEDREPAEYCREKARVEARRLTTPQYRVAAARWPEFAEVHYAKLRPQICSLFRIPKSFNFIQWVLEYARETYPRIFGDSALSPGSLLELTDAICDSSVSSLHVAAALGLPSLCRDLISMGADVSQPGTLGTPLFCALVGPKVLSTGAEPESWTIVLDKNNGTVDRAATISLLLDKGADCKYKYRWKGGEEVSLTGLAFWAALITKHEDIFSRIVTAGAPLDDALLQLFHRTTMWKVGRANKTRCARLLTYVFDRTLLPDSLKGTFLIDVERLTSTDEITMQIRDRTCQLMTVHGLEFTFPESDRLLNTVHADIFDKLVRNSVLDADTFLFRRLSLDPRFNPNLIADERRLSGTILHMAIEGTQLEIVDILLKAGASLQEADANGRTPIMVVENLTVLSKLVLEHGATTTDADNQGRTIWHYAAASNDDMMLKWLCENDPSKEKLLFATNKAGATPLEDAFFYLNTLKADPRGMKPPTPRTAKLLLKEYKKLPVGRSMGLFSAAVEWGDIDLLEGLLKIEPDFKGRDFVGRSLSHFLNFSASEQLTDRVLEMCQGIPISNLDGSTAAESIITNTSLYQGELVGFAHPTDHPSCHHELSGRVYSKLLTRDVLGSRDDRGRGLWERFCLKVVPMLAGPGHEEPRRLEFLANAIGLAVEQLAAHGAMADYEATTGLSALVCLVKGGKPDIVWQRWKAPLIPAVLEASRNDATESFLKSFEGLHLLVKAIQWRNKPLVEMLIERDVPISDSKYWAANNAMMDDLLAVGGLNGPVLEILLDHVTPDALNERQDDLFSDISKDPDSLKLLNMLLEKGLDPNRVPRNSKTKRSMLAKSILSHNHKLTNFLLDKGADPAFGPFGYDGVMASAEAGCHDVLTRIITILKKDASYTWEDWYDEPGKPTYNPLQMAASKGHKEVLWLLLQRTPWATCVDHATPRNLAPPVHLAVEAGSVDCVEMLDGSAADLHALDGSGLTPWQRASRRNNREVIQYFIDEGIVDENQVNRDNRRRAARAIVNLEAPMELDSVAIPAGTAPDSDRRNLGHQLATAMDMENLLEGEARLDQLLKGSWPKRLRDAFFPCNGCTALSYAAKRGEPLYMDRIIYNQAEGFITGCELHWPDGFNALVDLLFHLGAMVDTTDNAQTSHFLHAVQLSLDSYIDLGIPWLHLPLNPVHAICQYKGLDGFASVPTNFRILKEIVAHLIKHAPYYYWESITPIDLLSRLDRNGRTQNMDMKGKVLYCAMNAPATTRVLRQFYAIPSGSTPLHILVGNFDDVWNERADYTPFYNMMNLLLSSGAEIDAQDDEGSTPLCVAVRNENEGLTKALLEAGANPNIRDMGGATPLLVACNRGCGEIIKLLLQHGAEIDVFSDVGNYFGHAQLDQKMIEQYLQLGLDLQFSEPLMKPSLLAQLVAGDQAVHKSYVLNGDWDFYRLAREAPYLLHHLLQRSEGSPRVLKKVIKRFPRECRDLVVNPALPPQQNAACQAVLCRNMDYLKILLDFGFDLERKCCSAGSALMFACKMGMLEAVIILVRRGARIAYIERDDSGDRIARSAVDAAAIYPDVVQWLLVGRYQDRKRLGFTDTSDSRPMMPWSGPQRASYRLPGQNKFYGRLRSESTLEYLKRRSTIREGISSRILPVKLFWDTTSV